MQDFDPEKQAGFVNGNDLLAEFKNYVEMTGDIKLDSLLDRMADKGKVRGLLKISATALKDEFDQPQCVEKRFTRVVNGEPQQWGLGGVRLHS